MSGGLRDRHLARRARRWGCRERAVRAPRAQEPDDPAPDASRRRRAARNSDDLELGALILCPEPVDQANKELVSAHAARLCKSLNLDAVIATKEGGGNADADVSLKMDRLEEEGITAIGILAEMAGRDGTGPPLVVPPTKATALVSTGNYDERMTLPAVERALGRPEDRPARPGLHRRGRAARRRDLLRAEHPRLGQAHLRGARPDA